MAITVVKTIGTTGDYPTIADWIAAIPASLVAVDEIWRGELLDEAFSVAGQVFEIAGKTADATRYIELTAAAGASAFDAEGPLRYNPSSGARIIRTSSYGYTGRVTVPYTRISGLQIINTSTGTTAGDALYVSAANCDIDRCLLSSNSSITSDGTLYLRYATSRIRNSVVLQGGTSASYLIARMYDGASAYNTAFISTGTTLTNGVQFDYQTPILKNCYIAGATNPTSGGVVPTKTNCFSDVAAAGFSLAAYSTANFQDVSVGTLDLRKVAGSALIDAGADESTYSATDIFGVTRTLGSYDVGPDEFLAAGGPPTLTIINSSHSNTADNPSLDALGSLAIFDAIHSHATDSITLTATSNGTLTIPAIRDWGTKALKAGETGVTVDIYSKTTRGLVVSLTGQTTHATTAVCVVSDPAIVAGTTYRVVTEFADGSFGVWDYTAS